VRARQRELDPGWIAEDGVRREQITHASAIGRTRRRLRALSIGSPATRRLASYRGRSLGDALA
jgi:hypothetical protein